MVEPTFTYDVDAANRLITMRLAGREPSAHYADGIIAAYGDIPELWRYNRLIDHRKFSSLITMDDLKRMSEAWSDFTRGHDVRARVAILTRNPLTQARVAAHGALYPDQHKRTFTSVSEAMDWVLEHETVR